MSKRFRFVIVLALIAISAYFIYPTVRWYFFIPEETKELAAGSRDQIRDYAGNRAENALEELTELANEDGEQALPPEYSFLTNEARDIYRVQDREVPDEWTVTNTLAAFGGADEVYEVLETHYGDEMFAIKDIQNRIITLGLDLSGGMRVVVEADRASLEEALGESPTEAEVDEAIDLAVTILLSRIDQFGVTEPIVRRREGTDQIVIEVPGDADRARVESYLQGRGSLAFHLVDEDATAQLI
ncbi:MAG: protein translocase subunit SecD, partial [Spirochaetales bacterium]